jgi:hypothetical protein
MPFKNRYAVINIISFHKSITSYSPQTFSQTLPQTFAADLHRNLYFQFMATNTFDLLKYISNKTIKA